MYTEADRQRQTEIRVDGQIATFTDDSSRDRLIDTGSTSPNRTKENYVSWPLEMVE